MTKKIFTLLAVTCLAGLGLVAAQFRPAGNPTAAVTAPAGPSVETTVIQRTKYVRRHVRRKAHKASSGSNGSGGSAGAASAPSAYTAPASTVTPSPAPAPHPATSPSSTGGGEAEHENEREDHGGESEGQDD